MFDSLTRAGPRSLLKLVLALAVLLVGTPGLSRAQSDLNATTLHAPQLDIGDHVVSPALLADFDAYLNTSVGFDLVEQTATVGSDTPQPVRDTGSGSTVAALDSNVPNLGHLMRHQPNTGLLRHDTSPTTDADHQPFDLRSARVLPLRT